MTQAPTGPIRLGSFPQKESTKEELPDGSSQGERIPVPGGSVIKKKEGMAHMGYLDQ
jgi:hypothetical protein